MLGDRNTLMGMTCTWFLIQAHCRYLNTAHVAIHSALIHFGIRAFWISLSWSFWHISSFSGIKEKDWLMESHLSFWTMQTVSSSNAVFFDSFLEYCVIFQITFIRWVKWYIQAVEVPNSSQCSPCCLCPDFSSLWGLTCPWPGCTRFSSTLRLGYF